MKITGSMIQEALTLWIQRKDFENQRFKAALWQFEEDEKGDPIEIAKNLEAADRAVATLQNLQDRYNAGVQVKIGDEEITLADAIKRIGGVGRLHKLWSEAARSSGTDRWGRDEMTRKTDEITKKRQVSVAKCAELAEQYAQKKSQYRIAIRQGNQTTAEYPDEEVKHLFA